MKILLTNDDGMHAEQLVPFIRWWQQKAQVTVIVPQVEQSGKSHSIELHVPFVAKEVALAPDIRAIAMGSSPADCVRYGVLGRKEHFDLVISGINRGFNLGTDISYSGTVGAVFEAAILGLPAVAVSTCPEYYDGAIRHLEEIWQFFCRNGLMKRCAIYNVNIPPSPKGFRITRQGGAYYSDDFISLGRDNLIKPQGKCVHINRGDLTLDTDAALSGYISVTPLTLNRVDMQVYASLQELND